MSSHGLVSSSTHTRKSYWPGMPCATTDRSLHALGIQRRRWTFVGQAAIRCWKATCRHGRLYGHVHKFCPRDARNVEHSTPPPNCVP